MTAENRVGDVTCIGCHAEQAAFAGTAHHSTSTLPTEQTILGNFREGENVLRTANPNLHYRMEARADGFYQVAVLGRDPAAIRIEERFDVVMGSGRKGQTYLFWRDRELLYQLPVSYWSELDAWTHSPGYLEGVVSFSREVHPRCVECHSTYFPVPGEAEAGNRFDPEGVVLGISCETCHGSGREHLERQGSRFGWLFGTGIVNPARLSRERQIEACGLCHGGVGEPLAPSFTYLPGRPLVEHVRQPVPAAEEAVDVHGNQVALLRRSPCFQASAMTCTTCHDVHETERDPAVLSGTCLSCHQAESHPSFSEHGHALVGNCVGCHMPELPSNTIIARHQGQTLQPTVRSHWIRVYADEELVEAVGVPF